MSLTTSLTTLVQRTGSGGSLTTGSERAAFSRALQHDLSGLIGQLNTVYKPLVERLVSEIGLDALETGLAGNVVLTDAGATAGSAPAYWHGSKLRPRTLKETVDILLSDISRLENSIARSGGSDLQAIRAFIGMDTRTSTPNYSDHGTVTVVADGDSLETAVQKLDEAISTGGGGGGVTRRQQVNMFDSLNLTLNDASLTKAKKPGDRMFDQAIRGMGPLQFTTGTPFMWLVPTYTDWSTSIDSFNWNNISSGRDWAPDISFGQLTYQGDVIPSSYAWSLTDATTRELTGVWLGSTYFTDSVVTAEGTYYLEFAIDAGGTSDFRLGVINASDVGDNTVARKPQLLLGGTYPFLDPQPVIVCGTGYSSLGAVYQNLNPLAGTWPALASSGDVVGIMVKFTGLDTASFFGDGDFSAQVYYSLNGTWMNGSDPETDTGGIEIGTNVEDQFVVGVSLAHETCAKAVLEITDYSLINDGDYFLIDDQILSASVCYTGFVEVGPATLSFAHFRITEDPLGAATLHTLSGAVAENAAANEFLGTGSGDVKSASLVSVINDVASTIGASGFITATREDLGNDLWRVHFTSTSYVLAKSFSTSGSDGDWYCSPVAYGSFTIGTSNTDTLGNIFSWLRGSNPGNRRNQYSYVIRYPRIPESFATSVILYHVADNIAGNGVTCSYSGAGATISNFSGGTVDPVIRLVTDDLQHPPSFSYSVWKNRVFGNDPDAFMPLIFPNPISGAPAAPFSYSSSVLSAPPINYLYGRSIQLINQGGYDGGDIRLKYVRADTLAEEERTVNPLVVTTIDVPVAHMLEVEVAGAFTTGYVGVVAGPYWLPPEVPASIVGGVTSPSPIWEGEGSQAPMIFVADMNTGHSWVPVTIGGEDNNLFSIADMVANGVGPNAAMTRYYLGWNGWVDVTSDT